MKKICIIALGSVLFSSFAYGTDSDMVLIKGGEYIMGSASDIRWRGEDEGQHKVSVADFFIGKYEVSQSLYESAMGQNPSLNQGKSLPVENITWLDAVIFCNELSKKESLTPVYRISDKEIAVNPDANGYRLPSETEWEYACRAGTDSNYNLGYSISADDANYCGHYPYDIEPNYFNPENLKVQPGVYRQHTLPIDSFKPNSYGLYNMHGNVCEWVYNTYYGDYGVSSENNAVLAGNGVYKIYRGGGYNDFAKHLRSSYRGVLPLYLKRMAIGLRLARNADGVKNTQSITKLPSFSKKSRKGLVVYFSWSGNTQNLASIIASKTGSDLLELKLAPNNHYSENYSEVLVQAWKDQFNRTFPEIVNLPENLDKYETIYIGYPLWWASIPRPIASFLNSFNLSDKKIMIFSSGGGGHLQQSVSDLMKLSLADNYGSLFDVSYSGGRDVDKKIEQWLNENSLN